jgi:hypothetical protein
MKFNVIVKDSYFIISKRKTGLYTIEEILSKYDILVKYKFIYKYSKKFRIISRDDLIDEKYCGYFFTNVDYTEHLNIIDNLQITYIKKQLPSIKYLQKIKYK